METKVCSKCKQPLFLSCFSVDHRIKKRGHKSPKAKGRVAACKKCVCLAQVERRNRPENIDRYKAYSKKTYEKDINYSRFRNREWAKENKKHLSNYAIGYRLKNGDKLTAYGQKHRKQNEDKIREVRFLKRMRQEFLKYNISLEEVPKELLELRQALFILRSEMIRKKRSS